MTFEPAGPGTTYGYSGELLFPDEWAVIQAGDSLYLLVLINEDVEPFGSDTLVETLQQLIPDLQQAEPPRVMRRL